MILVRLFPQWLPPNSQVRLIPAGLWGDYCFLSVFIKFKVVCGATRLGGSRENPEEWQLTFACQDTEEPDQLQNWSAQVLSVWNIRIDDSQRTEDEIHLGLQNVQKGWVRRNFTTQINHAVLLSAFFYQRSSAFKAESASSWCAWILRRYFFTVMK